MRNKTFLALAILLAITGLVYAAGFDGNSLFFKNSSNVTYKVTPPGSATTMVGTDTTQTLTNKTLTSPTFNTGTWNTATLNDPAILRGSWNTGTLNTPTINTPIMHRGSWATGTANDPVINRGQWYTGTAYAPTINTPAITQGTWATGSFTSPTVTTPTINQGSWNTGTANDAVIARPTISLGSWSSGTSTDQILTRPTANLGSWNTASLNDPTMVRGTWATGTANDTVLNRPVANLGSWATASINDPAINRPLMALGSWSTATMTGKVTVPAASFTRTELSSAAGRKSLQVVSATITVVANSGDAYIIVPETGTLDSVDFSAGDTLATSDTNYLSFSVTNLGQAGAGTAVMLGAVDANTTKATGGSAITTNAKHSLTVHTTVANLAVTAGDRLLVRTTQTGTIANSVTVPIWLLRFAGTT